MNKSQRGFTVVETLLVVVVIALLGFVSWYTLTNRHQTENQSKSSTQNQPAQQTTPQKNGLYFRDKYQNAADKDKCLAEYYATYPQNRPENQQPGRVYVAPPCPGIAQ